MPLPTQSHGKEMRDHREIPNLSACVSGTRTQTWVRRSRQQMKAVLGSTRSRCTDRLRLRRLAHLQTAVHLTFGEWTNKDRLLLTIPPKPLTIRLLFLLCTQSPNSLQVPPHRPRKSTGRPHLRLSPHQSTNLLLVRSIWTRTMMIVGMIGPPLSRRVRGTAQERPLEPRHKCLLVVPLSSKHKILI